MKNLTPELIAKARATKSAEELFELAKANGVELTAEEANTYFAQLGANGAVSDDDLDAVAGGLIFDCGNDEEEQGTTSPTPITCGNMGTVITGCSRCGFKVQHPRGSNAICPRCKHTVVS